MDTKPWEETPDTVEVVPDDHEWAVRFPCIWGFMTARRGALGKVVLQATLTVLFEQGVVKVALVDRAEERSLWRSGATLDAGMGAIEEAIRERRADWRHWGGPKKSRRGT